MIVERDDATHHALNLLGQSIGIISLGKKLLLIEGEESSLDKQTYGAILKNTFPELVLVPVGGKGIIQSFDEVLETVINRTIWGVEFFMLCDRDAVYNIGAKSVEARISERLRVLPRYHLENYFLDEAVLAQVFLEMEPEMSWLRSKNSIADRLREFATQAVPLAVLRKVAATARESVGNVDIKPRRVGSNVTIEDLVDALRARVHEEKDRVAQGLDLLSLERLARSEFEALSKSIECGSDLWRRDIPGRIIFNRFASAASIPVGRLKALYLRRAQECAADPFAEIRVLFAGLLDVGSPNNA